jgi:hypothetical protein
MTSGGKIAEVELKVRTVGTGHSEHDRCNKTARTGRPEPNSKNMTASTGNRKQDVQCLTVRIRQPEEDTIHKESQDWAAGARQDRDATTEKTEQDNQDRTGLSIYPSILPSIPPPTVSLPLSSNAWMIRTDLFRPLS